LGDVPDVTYLMLADPGNKSSQSAKIAFNGDPAFGIKAAVYPVVWPELNPIHPFDPT
jgi:hypothetical protein